MRGPGLLSFFFVLFFNTICLEGQNLLNATQDDIMKYIKKNHPEMVLENDFKNDHYKYLKFTDGDSESCTMIYFMSEEDRCTGIRIIYDPAMKKEVISELNSKYRYVGENLWYDGKSKFKASVEMIVEDWFVTVTYSPVKSD